MDHQPDYVRRDEFSMLREEVRVGFAKTDAKIDQAHCKIDLVRAELNGRLEAGFIRLETKIARSNAVVLKWVFASQISVAAMFIAAIKYL